MTTDAGPEVQAAVSAAFQAEWGQVVATLIAVTGDWDLAEECAQDAFARALQAWERDGVPARPGAWLTTTARNRAVDVLRRRANESAKLREAALLQPAGADHAGRGPAGGRSATASAMTGSGSSSPAATRRCRWRRGSRSRCGRWPG